MPAIGLALGGGGARGLAHIHVLEALDDLGLKPSHIAGSSIGAIIGAAYAGGMSGREVRDFALECFARKRLIAGRLWRTRPSTFADFRADGGFRLGQLNAERLLGVFLPETMPRTFETLSIPLIVMATDFYAGREAALDEGDLLSALAASAALPMLFRPVQRDGVLLIDGGIYNPLPYDQLRGRADLIVACDVTGGPEGHVGRIPTPFEATSGASQLMMQSIIETKLKIGAPDLLIRPPVSRYRVLDFLHARTIVTETEPLREEVKRSLDRLLGKAGGDIDVATTLDAV